MTFEKYIQSLQDQFDCDNGPKGFSSSISVAIKTRGGTRKTAPLTFSTKDVCEAIARYHYQTPNDPFYSYQKAFVSAWYLLNQGIEHARVMVDKDKADYRPFLARGRDLEGEALKLWELVKDQPEINLREGQMSDPGSRICRLYDAVTALADKSQLFLNEVYAQLEMSETITNHYKYIRKNHAGNDKSFSLTALQMAIDKTLEKRANVRQKDLMDYFNMCRNTLKKHLKSLELDENELDSAMRGASRL